MFVNPTLGRDASGVLAILSAINQPDTVKTLGPGMLLCGGWSAHHRFVEPYEQYPVDIGPADAGEWDFYPMYGVCDTPEQAREYFKHLEDSNRQFCLTFVHIRKADQYPTGGWRWHKWGEYIGTQNPQYEYLYDEPDIEEVYTFHLYELNPDVVDV